MKILLYEWESFLQYDIKSICKEDKIEYDSFSWKFKDKNEDEAFEQWFSKNVQTSQYDFLLSVNYWPMLSKMAQENGLKYVAWCYDNPLNVIEIERTLANPVNYVFFFDQIQAEYYSKQGFRTVYYMPLGVNAKRLSRITLSAMERQKYAADVAFVGSLYESRFQDIKAVMNEYNQGFVDAIMNIQENLYGCYLVDQMITKEFVDGINEEIVRTHPDTNFRLRREALTFAMASEITRRERFLLLALMGRRFDTKLYSYQNSSLLEGVKACPPVDYVGEMPKVFQCAKINLNASLKCIQSGIPLRALDIMGAGGFLLSNYQMELAEYFVQGEEMVLYENMEDAVEKATFYLRNDALRQQIAQNGKAKIAENFSMQERLMRILEIVEE